jgi:hypothetical protein
MMMGLMTMMMLMMVIMIMMMMMFMMTMMMMTTMMMLTMITMVILMVMMRFHTPVPNRESEVITARASINNSVSMSHREDEVNEWEITAVTVDER